MVGYTFAFLAKLPRLEPAMVSYITSFTNKQTVKNWVFETKIFLILKMHIIPEGLRAPGPPRVNPEGRPKESGGDFKAI